MTTSVHAVTELIKVYPGVVAGAVAAGYGPLVRQWHAIRAEVALRGGRELFTRREVVAIFRRYGWDRTQYYKMRNADGAGLFFTFTADGLLLRGLAKVAVALASEPGQPVFIPAEAMRTQSKFQGCVYAYSFTRETTVSRNTLAKTWGISRSAQKRHEAQYGVERRQQCAKAHLVAQNEVTGEWLPVDDLNIPDGAFVWYDDADNPTTIHWQTPNRYKSHSFTARRGMSRKVGKLVRSGLETMGEVERERVFYFEAQYIPDQGVFDDSDIPAGVKVFLLPTMDLFDVARNSDQIDNLAVWDYVDRQPFAAIDGVLSLYIEGVR